MITWPGVFLIAVGAVFSYTIYSSIGELPTDLLANISSAVNTTLSRMVVTLAFMSIMVIQMSIAERTFSESQKQDLANLLDLGFVTIDAWSAIVILLAAWMLQPALTRLVVMCYRVWKYGDEYTSEEF